MKRLFPIAAASLLLVGCSAPNEDAASAPTTSATSTSTSSSSSATSATPSTSASLPTTAESEPAPTEQSATPTENNTLPAQSEMIQHGANVDRVNVFEDTSQQFWICDKAYPNGSPEDPFYGAANGCAGPYNSPEAAIEGMYRGVHDILTEEFGVESNFDDYAEPAPVIRNSDDIAAGIAEDMGCESAVFNEEIQGYEYVDCQ